MMCQDSVVYRYRPCIIGCKITKNIGYRYSTKSGNRYNSKISQMDAAKIISNVVGKSERTVRGWRATCLVNNGTFPDSQWGKFERSGVLWQNEDLNKQVTKYVRENNGVKGKPNMALCSFCKWVNEDLFQNIVLDPGFPRKIGLETGRKWLHKLGFTKLTATKGTYVDGHEREV